MKRILIIEDEAQTRRNIATILRMEGYEPLLTADGRKASRPRSASVLRSSSAM
jgi:DNA-binding response OmpR family regulator